MRRPEESQARLTAYLLEPLVMPSRRDAFEERNSDEAARHSGWRGIIGSRRDLELAGARDRAGNPAAEDGDRLAGRPARLLSKRNAFRANGRGRDRRAHQNRG